MAKILYVEDNLSLSFVTSDQLKKRGYHVVTCKDGKEALSTFNKDIFDLCILDVMLPIIDGFELAKKIRTENVHIPIIFLSARSMQEDKIEVFLKRKEINSGQNKSYEIGKFQLDVTEQILSRRKRSHTYLKRN